jgi:hypothetical protein
MPNINKSLGMSFFLIALAACGTTRHFVEQPQLRIDEPQKDARQAVTQLFGSDTPFIVRLCEADQSSKECKKEDEGITATGVGGLFIPLTLHVRGMLVRKERQTVDGLVIDVSLDAKADAISPLCGTVRGTILSRDNNTASVQLRNFYCNWAVVGNVLVNADLSIDSINLRDKVFTGFYKVTFHGTGNAVGSGYYRAAIRPKEAQAIGPTHQIAEVIAHAPPAS